MKSWGEGKNIADENKVRIIALFSTKRAADPKTKKNLPAKRVQRSGGGDGWGERWASTTSVNETASRPRPSSATRLSPHLHTLPTNLHIPARIGGTFSSQSPFFWTGIFENCGYSPGTLPHSSAASRRDASLKQRNRRHRRGRRRHPGRGRQGGGGRERGRALSRRSL